MNLPDSILDIINLKNEHFDLALSGLCQKYLQSLCANYLFFSFENCATQQRLVFNTNPDWYKYLIDANLIAHCPLYAATRHFCEQDKQGTSHFIWNQVIPQGRKQHEVVGLRAEHGIGNGVSFARRTRGHHIILGLGAELNNADIEQQYKLELPKIITLFTEASHICFNQFKSI